MKKRIINETLRKVKSTECGIKDFQINMKEFLDNFNLEENLDFTFRKFMGLSGLIDTEAPNTYYLFSILEGKITEDILDEEEDKLFLRYIEKEKELRNYLKEHPDRVVEVSRMDYLVSEILRELEENNVVIKFRGKYLDNFKLLSALSDKRDVEEVIIGIIKEFKLPIGGDKFDAWNMNCPSNRFLSEWIVRITNMLNIEGLLTEEETLQIADILMDVYGTICKVIILNLEEI